MTTRTIKCFGICSAPWLTGLSLVYASVAWNDSAGVNFPTRETFRDALAEASKAGDTATAFDDASFALHALYDLSGPMSGFTANPVKLDGNAPNLSVPVISTIGASDVTDGMGTAVAGSLTVVGTGYTLAKMASAPGNTGSIGTPITPAVTYVDVIADGKVLASLTCPGNTGVIGSGVKLALTTGTYQLFFQSRTAGGLKSPVSGPITFVVTAS